MESYARDVCSTAKRQSNTTCAIQQEIRPQATPSTLDNQHFGSFGGQYAPETLMFALDQLEKV